jgi:Na+/H+ antiporter NhaD/arsenite permease-like protein
MEPLPQVNTDVTRARDRPLFMLPLFALIAAVGGFFGSFTLRANLLVLGVGGALIWLGLTGRAGRRPAPKTLAPGAIWWFAPLLMLALVEVFAFSKKSIEDYPTLSLLADPILDGYLPRVVCYFAWLAGFWGLIRR